MHVPAVRLRIAEGLSPAGRGDASKAWRSAGRLALSRLVSQDAAEGLALTARLSIAEGLSPAACVVASDAWRLAGGLALSRLVSQDAPEGLSPAGREDASKAWRSRLKGSRRRPCPASGSPEGSRRRGRGCEQSVAIG